MNDYRQALERESERFDLAPGALDRLFDRRKRKNRNQRIGAALVALVVLAVGAWGAVSLLGGLASHPQPASSSPPAPTRQLYQEIAGTYAITLSNADPGVSAKGMAGTYTMRLLPNGVVRLSAPVGSLREGPSPSAINYRLSGSQFTINAFVNISCPGTVGTYLWQLEDGRLVLTPLHEVCAVRRTLFASKPWLVQAGR
ncbi:MAG TPA: hypothetical protein VNN79_18580 [Actinomycetota bacterium]|nr:hypothetical protein [Actinomycetota bacterium]